MIACYTCQNKTSKMGTKEIKISNLTYLMCEDCFETYKIIRGSEVLNVAEININAIKELTRRHFYGIIDKNLKLTDSTPTSFFIELIRYIGNKKVKKILVRDYGKIAGKNIYKNTSMLAKQIDKQSDEIANEINIRIYCGVYGKK